MIPIITSEMLSGYRIVRFAMSTRQGGVSTEPFGMNLSYRVGDRTEDVSENRSLFFNMAGLSKEALAIPFQCHSDCVRAVQAPGEYEETDGLVTNIPGLTLVVSVADCMPVALFDPSKRVIGLVHAGWRGTAKGIVGKGLTMMVDAYGSVASEVVAFLGPSASVCCYEIGPDVAKEFSAKCVVSREGKLFLDLKRANRDQLLDHGVRQERIEASDFCTICSPHLFHSYRRDQLRSGRMMAALSIVDEKG